MNAGIELDNKPRVGDRVKLVGSHTNAGAQGIYITDRPYYEGGELLPVVKLWSFSSDLEVFVADPENQMRKL